ncbi:MAG: hypothetical protein AABX54_00440 [Nanoarchaeota archaeon]
MPDKNLETDIERRLRESLEGFSLYSNSHYVGVKIINRKTHIGYRHFPNRGNFFDNHFDLQIEEETCFILGFGIEDGRKRPGFGRQLYELVERFCIREFDSRRFRTTPSGQSKNPDENGKCFWEKMGFEYINENEVEKVVK